MKIINAYIAHPIGGDVTRNVLLVEERCGEILVNRPNIQPLAPYLMPLKFLDDGSAGDRARGMAYNREFFASGFIDELWLYGNRISAGMWQEILWAREFGIPVIPMTRQTRLELIRRELADGSPVQIQLCGPTASAVGVYRGEREEDGRIVGVQVEACGRMHDLWWGDIVYIQPWGVPVESPKRLALN